MGNRIQRLVSTETKKVKGVALGLDGAGKSTILNVLADGECQLSTPTIGLNVETVSLCHGLLNVRSWDVGGEDQIRGVWRHIFLGAKYLIFVVDANDVNRIQESRMELSKILIMPELIDVPLLVLANKQDFPNALSAEDIANRMEIAKLCNEQGRVFHIQPCCALTRVGIDEAFEWLINNLDTATRFQKTKSARNTDP
jgi:ADP-ribosylation factor 1/2